MTKTLFLFSCFIFSITVFSQTRIKGQVVDSISSEPISFATLGMFSKDNPNEVIKGLALDENGKFNFEIQQQGDFTVVIQYVGKNALKKDINVTTQKIIDLGILKMSSQDNMLGEVSVTASRPLVSVEIDKLVYNMEEDPESKTNSAFEMLRKVPMVTIDADDNIQLKGSSSYKIYMNGKPSNMIANNPKDVLKGMPANTIKNIEVITEPGARYDAEGLAGIINIITFNQSAIQGYTASLNANVDNRGGFGGGAYFSTKIGKVGFTGNYNYYKYKNPWGDNYSLREDLTDPTKKYLKRTGSNKYNGDGQYGSGELSYEIDTLNLITVGFNRYQGSGDSRSRNLSLMTDISDARVYEYNLISRDENTYGNTALNVDYQNTAASNKDRFLTISYRFSNSPNDWKGNSQTENIFNFKEDQTHQYTDGKTNEHTVQIDYTLPIKKIHTIEVGLKYIARISESNNGYSFLNDKTNVWEDKTSVNDKFKHSQNIYSAYLSYKVKFKKKYGFQAGLRYEGTDLKAKYPLGDNMNFKNNYSNLVPSVNLSYMLSQTKTLKANYNMRIYRPGIGQLNPFVNSSDTNYIRKGNPDLTAVKSHSFGLTFSSFSQKLQFNTSFNYSFSNDDIESVTTLKDGVSIQTYDNIGKSQNVNLYTYFSWSITNKLKFYSNVGLGYADIKTNNKELNLSNHGFQSNIYGGLQYQVPNIFKKDAKPLFTFSMNGGGGSGWVSLMGKSSSYFFYSMSVNKALLNDKLNIRAYASNPFTKYRTNKNNQSTDTFVLHSRSQFKSQRFGISVSYRFGEMKAQIKKTKKGINNDDALSTGTGGGDGGGQGVQN